mgnify:CR=1 FL=1
MSTIPVWLFVSSFLVAGSPSVQGYASQGCAAGSSRFSTAPPAPHPRDRRAPTPALRPLTLRQRQPLEPQGRLVLPPRHMQQQLRGPVTRLRTGPAAGGRPACSMSTCPARCSVSRPHKCSCLAVSIHTHTRTPTHLFQLRQLHRELLHHHLLPRRQQSPPACVFVRLQVKVVKRDYWRDRAQRLASKPAVMLPYPPRHRAPHSTLPGLSTTQLNPPIPSPCPCLTPSAPPCVAAR